MKTSVRNIADAYRILGNAKVTKLEVSEVIEVAKARKSMRQIAEDFESYEKDCQEKLKYDGFDNDMQLYQSLLNKAHQGKLKDITEEENEAANRIQEYDSKVKKASDEEGLKEADIEENLLKAETVAKLYVENGWKMSTFDKVNFFSV